jgi:DNA-binding response OmpR family regulator
MRGMTQNLIRTVVVDDEHLARRRVRTLLAQHEDFEVIRECDDGPDAVTVIRETMPDLVFLDIKMVELDGLDVARAVHGPDVPLIVFVSAYDEYALGAFGVSACDYLLKPFDEERFTQTLERVREQVARKRGHAPSRHRYQCGDIEVEVKSRIVRCGGLPVSLRPKEYDLLLAFLKRPGVVITRRELLDEVWGYQHDVSSRTIDTHLVELRRKLSRDSMRDYIETISRIGYRFSGE